MTKLSLKSSARLGSKNAKFSNKTTDHLRGIEFFSGSGVLADHFEDNGICMFSTDHLQRRETRIHDLISDFLKFEYWRYSPDHFNFLFFGFPCTTFSKASGGFHFNRAGYSKTSSGAISELMIFRMFEIINYFKSAVFYIENPSGAIINNRIFKAKFTYHLAYIYTLSQGCYGAKTQKQTNIFTNSRCLLLCKISYRPRSLYSKTILSNMSTYKRSVYPVDFCSLILNNFLNNFKLCQI